jgi:subfamily B ATP-binding cassette protein MsbA
LIWRLGGQVRQITRVMQARLADLNARLQERLSSVRVVQLFAMEEYEREQFSRVNRETMKANLAAARITSALYPGVEFVALFGMIVVVAIAGWQVISAQLGTAVFFMFLVVLQRAGSQLSRLGRIRVAIQQALGAGERVFELLETESEVVEAPNAEVLPPVRGEVTFEHVTLRYRGGEEALRDVSFTIRPGEVVALVGPSGAGKTSLANLILRFYDPTEGTIHIDGRDLRRVTLSSLRGQVGTVPQETLLFGGTVHDNIVYGRIQATRDEVIAAAAAANADEFIAALPAGYDTPVGERGVKLSGGQRQRIAIARALLRNPRILILDEATSSLDAESEALVQEALERLMEGRTTLVIAHRLSTIRHADRILVLSDGRIVEEGTHIDLIRRQGVYSRLYERQIREQDAPASAG